MFELVDPNNPLLKALAALQPLALFSGAAGLILNAIAFMNTNKMARQQKSYEFMREFTSDVQLRACRYFIQDEFRALPIYEEWCASPWEARKTPIRLVIESKEETLELGYIVNKVSHFYDRLGILCAAKAIDADLIVAFIGGTIVHAWSILEPGIKADRGRREKNILADNAKYASQYIKYQAGFAYLASVARHKNPNFGRKLV